MQKWSVLARSHVCEKIGLANIMKHLQITVLQQHTSRHNSSFPMWKIELNLRLFLKSFIPKTGLRTKSGQILQNLKHYFSEKENKWTQVVKLFQKSIDRWIWNKQIPTLSLLLGTSFPTSSQAFEISLLNREVLHNTLHTLHTLINNISQCVLRDISK